MLDYWKLWIADPPTIERVLSKFQKTYETSEQGELTTIRGTYGGWKIQTLNKPYRLEIAGSIHKYWNGGTNENDISLSDARKATDKFCKEYEITPSLAKVINLEFAVNIRPSINASELIDQIISFNYKQPLRPYDTRPDYYFIEFESDEYYLKIYDKGKQYKELLPDTPNTLRLEIKGRNSGYLRAIAGINTLADLQEIEKLQVLGRKIAKVVKGVVFDDDTIRVKDLPLKDRKLYKELTKITFWKRLKGKTSSTTRNKITRFKKLVDHYGQRKIYSLINGLVESKIMELSFSKELAVFHSNYTQNTANLRVCLSCGKDISHQRKNSKYCSENLLGKTGKQCRNEGNNPRNNLKRKIDNINRKGTLFDITPFMVPSKKKRA